MKAKKSLIQNMSQTKEKNTNPISNESRALSRTGKAISIASSFVDQKPGFIKKINLAKTNFDYTDENKDSKLKVNNLII